MLDIKTKTIQIIYRRCFKILDQLLIRYQNDTRVLNTCIELPQSQSLIKSFLFTSQAIFVTFVQCIARRIFATNTQCRRLHLKIPTSCNAMVVSRYVGVPAVPAVPTVPAVPCQSKVARCALAKPVQTDIQLPRWLRYFRLCIIMKVVSFMLKIVLFKDIFGCICYTIIY